MDEDEVYPLTVNRCALAVTGKQAFVDWLHSRPGNEVVTLETLNRESTFYLVPESNDDPLELVKAFYECIFELELEAWHSDESLWPEDRSWEVFQRFFEVRGGSMVYDLADYDLATDE